MEYLPATFRWPQLDDTVSHVTFLALCPVHLFGRGRGIAYLTVLALGCGHRTYHSQWDR